MTQSDPPAVTTDAAPDAARQALRSRRRLGLSVAALGVLLFALLLLRILGPKPVPPPTVVHYTPQQAADAQKDFDALRAQMLAPPPVPPASSRRQASARVADTPEPSPVTAAPAPKDTPVRMQLSQADLNTYLATDPHLKALLASRGVQAVQLLLQEPHNVTCRAAVLYKGRRTNVQIVGSLRPSQDTVARFVATGAQVGALPLPPGVVTAQANRLAAQFTGRMRGRFPILVQNIQVVGDHLILTGVRRSFAKR